MASLCRQLTPDLALNATTSWTSCRRKATPMMRGVLISHSSLLSSSRMRGLLPQGLASQSYVNWRMRRRVRSANFSYSPGPEESNRSSSFGAEATAGEDESGCENFFMLVTLVRHKESKRVVYLEGGVKFVEFLLNFLLVPVGFADVRNKLPAPCLDNLYKSVEGLDESLLSERNKDILLARRFPAIAMSTLTERETVFMGLDPLLGVKTCSYYDDDYYDYSDGPYRGGGVPPPPLPPPPLLPLPKSTTFIVTDSLQVYTPTSDVIVHLVSRAIERTQDLETVQVRVEDRQAKELFDRAFTSDTVLNDVFGPH